MLATVLLAVANTAGAADLVIYDEALENGFVGDYSYGGGTDFASQTQAHSPTHSIAFSGNNYNAVSLTHPTASFSTADFPTLHFWIRGDAPGGQQLQLFVYSDRDNVATSVNAPLDGFIAGGAVSSTEWREVTVPLTQAPLSFNGSLERLDLQSEANGAAQTTIYLDDVALLAPSNDLIFKSGFDGSSLPPPACGMTDEHGVTAAGMLSDRFDWCDASGAARVAVLAHNDAGTGPGGSHGGELREFRYETGVGTRIVGSPARIDGGFGYIVSHPLSEAHCVGGDSSSLGHVFAGTWTRIFEGRHHAIFRFQQNYPRYCTAAAPAAEHDIPVTIDWIFSNGRDDPLWAVTFDMNGFSADLIEDDSRAPYGTLNIDGSTGLYMDSAVGGIAWGDRKRFTTTGANAATLDSSWSWNAANSVPYTELWAFGNEAAMGLVQTQTMTQQDAGGGRQPYGPGTYDVSAYWGATSAGGKACPDGTVDQQTGLAHYLPCVGLWPYQMNGFSYSDLVNATDDAKMTWGTQYGFLGQTAYDLHDSTLPGGSTAAGWPRKSYSLYVVFGSHADGVVGARVAEVEAAQTATLSIVGGVGGVAGSGPAGVNRADTINYAPAGYDPVYGALTFVASGNALDANIAVGAGTLHHPLLIVRNYGGADYPTAVKLNGAALVVDVDYLPSLRAGANELWITLNKDIGGANNELQILP